jgi:hypothetical protein
MVGLCSRHLLTATRNAAAQEIVAIAAGGPAESNSAGGDYSFVADEDFSGGGDNSVTASTINLTQPGANAAPMAVYQHGRAGIFTYTIPGLTAGTQYSVLLHFAETYFTAAGNRVFNVTINGTTVLSNFDIFAKVGVNAALIEQFTATANSSGQIVIAFTDGTANQPLVSGIEIRGATSSCGAVPSAPGGLTALASSASVINLSWTAVTPPANCTHRLLQRLRKHNQRLYSRRRQSDRERSDRHDLLQHRPHRLDHLLLCRRSARRGRRLCAIDAGQRKDLSAIVQHASLSTHRSHRDRDFFRRHQLELDCSDSARQLHDQLL